MNLTDFNPAKRIAELEVENSAASTRMYTMENRVIALEARELELVEQLRRVVNVNSAAVAIMTSVTHMHSYDPGEAATIKQAESWLRAHENTKGQGNG